MEDIVGYAHGNGYCLCRDCGSENHWDDDDNVDIGVVTPILAGCESDNAICDRCGTLLEDIALSQEGIWQTVNLLTTEIARCSEAGAFNALITALRKLESVASVHGMTSEDWAVPAIEAMIRGR